VKISKGTIKRLHVNQNAIRRNTREGLEEPPLTVQHHTGPKRTSRVDLLDETGEVVASLIYRPRNPLSCGARVWLETKLEVSLVDPEPT